MRASEMVEKKIKLVRRALEGSGAQGALIVNRGNFLYLTGVDAGGVIYIEQDTDEIIALVPLMEFWKVSTAVEGKMQVYAVSKIAFNSHPDYPVILGSVADAVSKISEGIESLAVDSDPILLNSFQEVLKKKRVVNASREITMVRRIKMTEEIELISKASEISERALERIINILRPGLSEKEIYAELLSTIFREGADALAFDPIVAIEENASNPHAIPGERKLRRGNAVVFDLGAKKGSYCSDMTRTILFGASSYRPLLESLISAYSESLDMLRAGIPAKEVDLKARSALSWRRLDINFIHSLGHGVGVEVHEPPTLSPASEEVLMEGDVVTIEPGFYIPRKLGMRVENTVVVTENGGKPLNRMDVLIEV
ncbi:MAG: Xaa-Pro peptidase family protein [Fervidicoccaceae archaeon]